MVYPEGLSPEECQMLIDIFKGDVASQDVLPGAEGKQLTFIELLANDCVAPMYKKMLNCVIRANQDNFDFDPNLFVPENMYINLYSSDDDNYRGWHVDGVFSDNPYYSSRKLSAVVQLSLPSSYAGGDLKFMEYHNPEEDIRQQGTILVFPAFEWHKVERVTTGNRYSMVMFVNGRPFR
jgi:PKHD-type hydroxylase